MDKIFISYRREDSAGFARGLFQSLTHRFGKKQVFMDVEAIALGMDFMEAIDSSLSDCGALLVIIGKDWVTCTDSTGQRRLDNPDDPVRIEVAKALERNVRVIPVLVKGAQMPKPEALPEDLRPLTRRQAHEMRHKRWDHDADHLAGSLEKALGLKRIDLDEPGPAAHHMPRHEKPAAVKRRSKKPVFVGAALTAVLLAGTFIYMGLIDTYTEYVEQDLPVTPAPEPLPIVTPAPAPKPPPPARPASITGMWSEDDGAQVEIIQTGNTAVSQAIDPATGVLIRANWRLQGNNFEFNWVAASGNQGYGRGTISSDGNTIQYEAVDYVTGVRDTGRLIRSAR